MQTSSTFWGVITQNQIFCDSSNIFSEDDFACSSLLYISFILGETQ